MPTFNSRTLMVTSASVGFSGGKTMQHIHCGENRGQVPCVIGGIAKFDPKIQAEDTRDAGAISQVSIRKMMFGFATYKDPVRKIPAIPILFRKGKCKFHTAGSGSKSRYTSLSTLKGPRK